MHKNLMNWRSINQSQIIPKNVQKNINKNNNPSTLSYNPPVSKYSTSQNIYIMGGSHIIYGENISIQGGNNTIINSTPIKTTNSTVTFSITNNTSSTMNIQTSDSAASIRSITDPSGNPQPISSSILAGYIANLSFLYDPSVGIKGPNTVWNIPLSSSTNVSTQFVYDIGLQNYTMETTGSTNIIQLNASFNAAYTDISGNTIDVSGNIVNNNYYMLPYTQNQLNTLTANIIMNQLVATSYPVTFSITNDTTYNVIITDTSANIISLVDASGNTQPISNTIQNGFTANFSYTANLFNLLSASTTWDILTPEAYQPKPADRVSGLFTYDKSYALDRGYEDPTNNFIGMSATVTINTTTPQGVVNPPNIVTVNQTINGGGNSNINTDSTDTITSVNTKITFNQLIPPVPAPSQIVPIPPKFFAPFVDITSTPPPNIITIYNATTNGNIPGCKYFTLAFLNYDVTFNDYYGTTNESCQSWAGIQAYDSSNNVQPLALDYIPPWYIDKINTIRSAPINGDVIISLGGENNTDIVQFYLPLYGPATSCDLPMSFNMSTADMKIGVAWNFIFPRQNVANIDITGNTPYICICTSPAVNPPTFINALVALNATVQGFSLSPDGTQVTVTIIPNINVTQPMVGIKSDYIIGFTNTKNIIHNDQDAGSPGMPVGYKTYLGYKAVIDTYSLSIIDFDIEGKFALDSTAFQRRNQALLLLQQDIKYQNIKIHFTLATLQTGLTDALPILAHAESIGLRIDVVNLMVMDYGAWIPLVWTPGLSYNIYDSNKKIINTIIPMGAGAALAAMAVYGQIQTIVKANTGTSSFAKTTIGLTPMIGWNDGNFPIPTPPNTPVTEIFSLQDASNLLSFINSDVNTVTTFDNGPGYSPNNIPTTVPITNIYGPDFITRISFWSINRDNQYPPATPPNSLSVNSYVNQDQWGFTNIFQAFNA